MFSEIRDKYFGLLTLPKIGPATRILEYTKDRYCRLGFTGSTLTYSKSSAKSPKIPAAFKTLQVKTLQMDTSDSNGSPYLVVG